MLAPSPLKVKAPVLLTIELLITLQMSSQRPISDLFPRGRGIFIKKKGLTPFLNYLSKCRVFSGLLKEIQFKFYYGKIFARTVAEKYFSAVRTSPFKFPLREQRGKKLY
jgi:hypothetical protein